MVTEESYLTPAEVAAIYRVTDITIRSLIRKGDIPAVRVGHSFRVPRSFVETMHASVRTAGAGSERASAQQVHPGDLSS